MNTRTQTAAARVVRQTRLRPSDHGRKMTLEEFERTIDEPGYRFELVRGRIEVSAEPEEPHDEDAEWIGDALRAYSQKHPSVIGRVSEHARIYLPESNAPTCLEPDIAVFRHNSRSRPLEKRKWKYSNAILVVEILSPDTAKKDLERNVPLYLQVQSIREYWIVDSREHLDQPKLIVYRRRGQRWQKPIEVSYRSTYETKLLPGFKLIVDPRA